MRITRRVLRRHADLLQKLAHPRLLCVLIVDQAESADRLQQDVADAPARVEARIGRLEDHLQLLPKPGILGLAGGLVEHRLSVDPDAAAVRRLQPDDHLCDGGLSRPALADKGIGLAFPDAEADLVHRRQHASFPAAYQTRQKRIGNVEMAAQVSHAYIGRTAHHPALRPASAYRWQATPFSKPGASLRHAGMASPQRG